MNFSENMNAELPVLVFEPDIYAQEQIVSLAKSFGCSVYKTVKPEEIRKLSKESPSIIFGALTPHDGPYSASFWEGLGSSSILILVGAESTETVLEAENVQADYFVFRPLSFEILRLTFRQALRRWKITKEQKESISKIKHLNQQLRQIQEMSLLLNSEKSFDRLFNLIIKHVTKILGADRTSLFLLDENGKDLWTKVAEGIEGTIRIPLDKGLVGQSFSNNKPLIVDDAWEHPGFDKNWDQKYGYRTRSVLCYPVRNRQNEIKGILQGINKLIGGFDRDDLELAEVSAAQVGVALENFYLVEELRKAFESFIRTLTTVIDAKHPLTAGHSHRVTEYSLFLGAHLGLSNNEMEVLKYATLLHDIGKIGVIDSVLTKNGRFTDEERLAMNEHSCWTFKILKEIRLPDALKDIPKMAACHHEKMDGTGYPYGLKGEDIPYYSRIIAVADVFDALTSLRDYPKYDGDKTLGFDPLSMDRTFDILNRDKGKHFDPEVADAAIACRPDLQALWQTLYNAKDFRKAWEATT